MFRYLRSGGARCWPFSWLLLAAGACLAQSLTPVAPTAMVLELTLNGVDLGPVLTLRSAEGVFYFSEANLKQWGVCQDLGTTTVHQGETFRRVGSARAGKLLYDAARQSLDLTLPASCFAPTDISLGRHASALTPAAPGMIFNYDFYASGAQGGSGSGHTLTGLFEAVGFDDLGSTVVDVLAPHIGQGDTQGIGDGPGPVVRLDTAFTHDNAEQMTRWELGDAIGGSGIWGRPVRFAGVRFSRNFDTSPGFVTQPLPSVAGEAELPSTVEVYLNGVLATRQQVQPGTFQIDNVPMFGVGGTVQLVVRDLLGHEVVTDMPFVTAAPLLKRGLSDFSLETGILRDNYGISSFDYGTAFATATGRYGVSDELTVEGRSETREGRYTAGAGASFVLPVLHYVLTVAGAGSHAPSGSGDQETFSLQPGVPQRVALSLSWQTTSAGFVQLGTAPGQPPPSYVGTASLSIELQRRSAITLSEVRNAPRGRAGSVIDSVAVNRGLGTLGSLSLSLFATREGPTNKGLLLGFSVALYGSNSVVSSVNLQRGDGGGSSPQLQSEFDHAPTSELGWGWDVRTVHDDATPGTNTLGAGFIYQGNSLSASGQLDGNLQESRYQLDISGGTGVLAGRIFASRRIFDSFGVARVAGVPGLPVYVENQLAGYTDANGLAVLPRLISFSDNKISINANDLPFNAVLDGSDSITVAPYSRTGVVVDLPVRRFRSALVSLMQADGSPVPVGAKVSYLNGTADVYVAARGEAYLRDVQPRGNTLEVNWEGHHCQARFDLPQGSHIQPHIGPLTCSEAP